MTNSQSNDPSNRPQDIPPAPGQHAAASWDKTNPERSDSMPAPPPVWTRFIDYRFKQDCSH